MVQFDVVSTKYYVCIIFIYPKHASKISLKNLDFFDPWVPLITMYTEICMQDYQFIIF